MTAFHLRSWEITLSCWLGEQGFHYSGRSTRIWVLTWASSLGELGAAIRWLGWVQWHGYDYTSLDIDVDLTLSVPFSDWPVLLPSDRSPQPAPAIFDTTVGYHAITVINKVIRRVLLKFVVLVTSGRSHSISHCVTVQTVSETFDMQFWPWEM